MQEVHSDHSRCNLCWSVSELVFQLSGIAILVLNVLVYLSICMRQQAMDAEYVSI